MLDRRAGSELMAVTATKLTAGVIYDPVVNEDGSPERLFEAYSQLSWKLHGYRSGFVNWLIILGFPKDIRSVVGRWSPSGSDEYLRTQRTITWKTQEEVAAKIRKGKDLSFLGESDLWQEFSDWADGIGMPAKQRDWQIKKFRMSFHDSFVAQPDAPGSASDGESMALSDHESDGGYPRVFHPQLVNKEVAMEHWKAANAAFDTDTDGDDVELQDSNPVGIEKGRFVVSFTSKGAKRTLHRVGKCWRRPAVHYGYFKVLDEAETLEQVNKDEFEAVCRDCYSCKKRPAVVSHVEDVPGSSDSGSSSSDTTVVVHEEEDQSRDLEGEVESEHE